MAAAAEEDTELRDLLVQTLESSGVLNKIKVLAGEGLVPWGARHMRAWWCGGGQSARWCQLH